MQIEVRFEQDFIRQKQKHGTKAIKSKPNYIASIQSFRSFRFVGILDGDYEN